MLSKPQRTSRPQGRQNDKGVADCSPHLSNQEQDAHQPDNHGDAVSKPDNIGILGMYCHDWGAFMGQPWEIESTYICGTS